ncbi:MAG: long-chain-fatty-acid--CoA ligase [Rhodospirillales bacterium]
MYLTQSLKRAISIRPEGLATAFQDRERNWTEIGQRVAKLAGGLQSLGLKRGDRVAILALNSDRYLEFMYAAPWAGMVMVPLNTRLAGPEVDYILEDSDTKALFVDQALAPLLEGLKDRLKTIKLIALDDGQTTPGAIGCEDLIARSHPTEDALVGGNEMAGLFYTGGTTGKSKGVMLSHDNLMANAMIAVAGMRFEPDTFYLHSAPMFHLADGASTFGVTMAGGSHAFVPRFEPVAVLGTIQQRRITNGQFVPTMINMLVNHPRIKEFDISTLKFVIYGASPMPEGVLLKALEVMPDCALMHGYGMTEASPIVTLLPTRYTTLDGSYAGRIKSCGQPAHTVEVKIVDEDRNEVPFGTRGELAIRGPNIMLGYWNKPQETAAVLVDGWYYSGDAGYMDAEGFVFIVDRLKDMIISGGENIYSAEVEDAISKMPQVAEMAVIGVPDEKWGERVHAVVVPRAGQGVTPEEVMAHCHKFIAGYKCPRSVEIRKETLPLSGAGKILKTVLREPYWRGRTKGVN